MSDTTVDVSAAAPDEREALYVDIANRAQEITGRGIWPSTVKAVLEVAASVFAAAPVVIDPHSSHHQPVPGCAYCPQPVYATGANAAAAPDDRARVIAWNGWIDDHRDHGSVTRELMAAFDAGWAAAVATRPAPVVSTADADVREALRERIAAAVDAVTRLGVAVDAVLAALGFTVADETEAGERA